MLLLFRGRNRSKRGEILMTVKLITEVFNKLTKDLTDSEISKIMNISTTQLWRARLPDDDPRHNDPGSGFIAGALRAFPDKKFEDLFFLTEPLRERNVMANIKPTGTEGGA